MNNIDSITALVISAFKIVAPVQRALQAGKQTDPGIDLHPLNPSKTRTGQE